MTKKKSAAVRIRPLTRHEEFKRLIEVLRRVFRYQDRDLIPLHELSVISRMGGVILGAFRGGELAGFVYSFPAVFEGRLVQHSHVLAVLPEYQGCGIGKKLKLAQRDRSLKLGYRKITWTFDPLQAKNANLNLHCLGTISRIYLRNLYGIESELCLGPGIPTDRLLVEWPSAEKGSTTDRSRRADRLDFGAAAVALAKRAATDDPRPGPARLGLKSNLVLAEVPCDVNAWRPKPEIIAAWRKALRRVLEHYFKRGYAARDLIFGERCFYILAPPRMVAECRGRVASRQSLPARRISDWKRRGRWARKPVED